MTEKPKAVSKVVDYAKLEEITNKLKSRAILLSISHSFLLLATVMTSFLIIPLLWMRPMVHRSRFHLNSNFRLTRINCVFLGICCILFTFLFGVLSGILLIIASSKTVTKKELLLYKQNR